MSDAPIPACNHTEEVLRLVERVPDRKLAELAISTDAAQTGPLPDRPGKQIAFLRVFYEGDQVFQHDWEYALVPCETCRKAAAEALQKRVDEYRAKQAKRPPDQRSRPGSYSFPPRDRRVQHDS